MKPRRRPTNSPARRPPTLGPTHLVRYLIEDAVGALLDLRFGIRDWKRGRRARRQRATR